VITKQVLSVGDGDERVTFVF